MWNEAEKFLLKDKYIAPLIKKYGRCMLKHRQEKYYFEDLVDAIVQQQLSMKAASSIFNRLKEAVIEKRKEKRGKQITGEGKQRKVAGGKHKWRVGATISTEITPRSIQNLSDGELIACGLSRAKVKYVKGLSDNVIDGRLKLHVLKKLPETEVIKKLVSVKGVGEWTAHMFLMFSLGRADIFPIGDLGLRNAFSKTIKEGLDKKQIEKFALRWKPYRTIASWYIWKTLEN